MEQCSAFVAKSLLQCHIIWNVVVLSFQTFDRHRTGTEIQFLSTALLLLCCVYGWSQNEGVQGGIKKNLCLMVDLERKLKFHTLSLKAKAISVKGIDQSFFVSFLD